jgi:hypothetical protein
MEVGKPCYKCPSLGKKCPYLYKDMSTMVVDNILHRINPNSQRNTYQNFQGMIENHQENIALGHPWVLGKLM